MKNIVGIKAEVARRYLGFPFSLYYLYSFLMLWLLTSILLEMTWLRSLLWSSFDATSSRGCSRETEAIALNSWVLGSLCSNWLLTPLPLRSILLRSRKGKGWPKRRKSSRSILRTLQLWVESRRLMCWRRISLIRSSWIRSL